MSDGTLHTCNDYPGKIYPALLHDATRTEGAKLLYAHMHWRYGRNKDNHEGQASMAKHMDVSEVTISKRILELEYADWIVVELRDRNEKSGNYTTPFYHVFEKQDECRKFRAEYKPGEGSIIRKKPAKSKVKHRSTRKGKGGLTNPENRHRLNSDSDGGLNSDSARALNPDSDKQPPLELPSVKPPLSSNEDSTLTLWSVIQTAWESDSPLKKTDNPRLAQIRKWLKGDEPTDKMFRACKSADFDLAKLDPAATPGELRHFFSVYRTDPNTQNADYPRGFAKFVEHFMEYRKRHPKRENNTRTLDDARDMSDQIEAGLDEVLKKWAA